MPDRTPSPRSPSPPASALRRAVARRAIARAAPARRAFTLAEVLVSLAILTPLIVVATTWQQSVLAAARTTRDRELWLERASRILASLEHRALRDTFTPLERGVAFSNVRLTLDRTHLLALPISPDGSPADPHPILSDIAFASFTPEPPRLRIRLQSTWGDSLERLLTPLGAVP